MLIATLGYGGIAAAAPKLTVLFSFQRLWGTIPRAGLITDGAGNLYGTTETGGAQGRGIAFELTPPPAGQKTWTETVLQSFGGDNGESPVARLVADGAGNLYGTTVQGGANNDGAVFELSPPATGQPTWNETVLHSFNAVYVDGTNPSSTLIVDGAGNLYGTTSQGGANNDGAVFELTPPGSGQTTWTETLLHVFGGADGADPLADLIADGAGNLYGTTDWGGAGNEGVVFELRPPKLGHTAWTETLLYVFAPTDGRYPAANGRNPTAGVIADAAGDLYGTASGGGRSRAGNDGLVFKLTH